MTCPTCRGSGHHPDAPWLLCPEDCEAAERVRERTRTVQQGMRALERQRARDFQRDADRQIFGCEIVVDPAVPPGEVHLVSGGKLVRLLGVEP